MKFRMLVTTIALALIASIAAVAAPKEGKGKGGGGLLPPPIVEKLSDEQKAKYKDILAEAKEAHGDKEKMKAISKKLQDILNADQKAELKKWREEHAGKGKKK
jgi:ABC-type phosphate transport system substrate-binding protein